MDIDHENRVHSFVIFDDCIITDAIMSSYVMRNLIINNRQYKITLVITLSTLLQLPPVIRSNLDYLFVGNNNPREKEKIYDSCYGLESKAKLFSMINKFTVDYTFFVIHHGGDRISFLWYRVNLALKLTEENKKLQEEKEKLKKENEELRNEIEIMRGGELYHEAKTRFDLAFFRSFLR